MDIRNFVRLDRGILVIFEYFWRSCGTGDFSKVTIESFEIDIQLFIAFRVKLSLKKTSSELICDYY